MGCCIPHYFFGKHLLQIWLHEVLSSIYMIGASQISWSTENNVLWYGMLMILRSHMWMALSLSKSNNCNLNLDERNP